MGCIHSKRAVSVAAASPVLDFSSGAPPPLRLAAVERSSGGSSKNPSENPSGSFGIEQKQRRGNKHRKEGFCNEEEGHERRDVEGVRKLMRKGSGKGGSLRLRMGFSSHRDVGVEQIAAGWPAWLSSAAAEAIDGWVPLRADAFEKLEKIGQGTYSSVFRAREVETGRMVALKKVRFDNFQPESIRFMAREIVILRRLDHPNIIKLIGIITSRLSNSIYLVFEYMEHDLAGLSSSPNIKFSESQVKCYMKQLLLGIEHCHLRGIMHRDIKTSNILVNNEGNLKLGDFGLANVLNLRNRQQLTSRVVTLWYRPPELLMGSTSYEVSVDLWSVGCVFAELLIGKPLLKGRTEVEQLHKIFKLCGSPPDEYWKQSKIPNATMFRPQHSYESSLREKCKDFPPTTVDLIETFLSVEPEMRGTASSALLSQYFNTMPYACEPSSLPKYPPNKELDAKYREEARRKKAGSRTRDPGASRKTRRVHRTLQAESFNKFSLKDEAKDTTQFIHKTHENNPLTDKGRGGAQREQSLSFDTTSNASDATKGDYVFTGPAPVMASSGFAWARKRKGDAKSTISYDQSISSSQISELDSSRFSFVNGSFDWTKEENERHNSHEAIGEDAMFTQRKHIAPQGSFDMYDLYDSKVTEEADAPRRNMERVTCREKVEFSGPLLSQSDSTGQLNKIDEILQRNENQIRRAAHRSRLDREM